MMQLVCNGVVLDMYADTNLQLKHENPLFAFDNLKCERTTNFKLPATPTNDRVFELAKIPAFSGEGMRRRFDAQLQAGTIVKNGYLYVSSFDGKDYNATFVTGELVGLQKIKDLGKIKDIMTYTDTVQVGSSLQYGYTARQNNERWANIRYAKPIAPLVRPSVCLSKIYADIIAQENLTAEALPTQAQQLWLISAMKAIEQDVTFSVVVLDRSQPSGTPPTNPFNSATSDVSIFETEETEYGIVVNSADGYEANQFFKVVQFKAKTDIILEIPDNWEETQYIFDLSLTHDGGDAGHFYGGRYFTDGGIFDTETHIYPQGEPLAGRSVQIAAGECFSFVDSRYYQNFRIEIMGQYRYNSGFFLQENSEADFANEYNLTVKTDGDLKNGDLCRLQDNLPDITFVELLKIFAAVSGRVLSYDDVRGIYFDEVNFSDWGVKEVDKITKRGEVKRVFSDYVKKNIIDYKSEDGILFPISTTYTIDNDNLSDEKTLMTIPFSEGEQNKDYPTQVYIGAQSEEPTLASDAGEDVLLQRVQLPKNNNIQALCDASTQIKIDARMPLLTYEDIKPNTVLLVDNSQHLWTDRSWQKDVAQFTLARAGEIASRSPYNNITTAFLKKTFPNSWSRILQFGIDNPNFISIIEAEPLSIISLLDMSGLVRVLKTNAAAPTDLGIITTDSTILKGVFVFTSVTGLVHIGHQGENDQTDWRIFCNNNILYYDNGQGRVQTSPFYLNTIAAIEAQRSIFTLNGNTRTWTAQGTIAAMNMIYASRGGLNLYGNLVIYDGSTWHTFIPYDFGLLDISNNSHKTPTSGSFTIGYANANNNYIEETEPSPSNPWLG